MLSIGEFGIDRQVFEAKFPSSYLLWDRSGEMWSLIARDFEGMKLVNAVPTSVQFETPSFYLVVEHNLLRIAAKGDIPFDEFAGKSNSFFRAAISILKAEVFSRLGFRTIWSKQVQSLAQARELLAASQMLRVIDPSHFGIDAKEPGVELRMTWEDSRQGLTLGLRTESRHVEAQIPWEYRRDFVDLDPQDKYSLVVDVDIYTLGQIRRDQIDVREWMGSARRVIKKGLSKEIFQ